LAAIEEDELSGVRQQDAGGPALMGVVVDITAARRKRRARARAPTRGVTRINVDAPRPWEGRKNRGTWLVRRLRHQRRGVAMNCDLCPGGEANVALLGAGGPMFCNSCLLAVLLEAQNEGSLRQIMATIKAHRENQPKKQP
jgi:hypothetical protein